MGPTETLAKLANSLPRNGNKRAACWMFLTPGAPEKLMRIVPVGEVWGIGARTTAKLNQLGIHTRLGLGHSTQ